MCIRDRARTATDVSRHYVRSQGVKQWGSGVPWARTATVSADTMYKVKASNNGVLGCPGLEPPQMSADTMYEVKASNNNCEFLTIHHYPAYVNS